MLMLTIGSIMTPCLSPDVLSAAVNHLTWLRSSLHWSVTIIKSNILNLLQPQWADDRCYWVVLSERNTVIKKQQIFTLECLLWRRCIVSRQTWLQTHTVQTDVTHTRDSSRTLSDSRLDSNKRSGTREQSLLFILGASTLKQMSDVSLVRFAGTCVVNISLLQDAWRRRHVCLY